MNIRHPVGKQRSDEVLRTGTTESDESHEIDSLLFHLELCLETPVVPGELPSWSAATRQAAEALAEALQNEIHENHPDDFAEISNQDPDLLRQVEQLRAEDTKLLQQYEEFAGKISRFRERAERAEPHESKLDEQLSEIVEEGLALVIRIRTQQQAISTWLMESFQRDTGVAD
jgi:benzoyl-CoA reductase/2-hydroxyglutaryl-CoA dehydratase subunit BcrC/BadD/HgdB